MKRADPTPHPLRIGQLAALSGLTIDTIRFYEKQGLIPSPRRSRSNYRVYDQQAVSRLVFIRKARDLGFTLQEIAQLLALSEDREAGAGDVKERAQDKLADLDRRIAEMQRMRASLEKLVHACSGHGPRENCPILAALTDPD
jgi:MerR family copper efflux transcriptional regulator